MKKYFFYIPLVLISLNLYSKDDLINELSLPELGDRVSGAVSSSEEKAIGEMFLKQVYSQAPLISDPILFVPPLQTSESSPLIKGLKDATREVLGKASTIETFPGSTDAPNFKCSAVIFGAGNLKQCHSLTEYINLKDLEKAVKVYIKTIEHLQG